MSPENVSPISIEDKSPTISSANIIIFSQYPSSFYAKTAPLLPFSAILINNRFYLFFFSSKIWQIQKKALSLHPNIKTR